MVQKKKIGNRKSSGGKVGRAKPSAPRAGFMVDGRRYEGGGKVSK